MPVDPFAFDAVTELLDRSRALQRATALVTADAWAAFARLLAVRAALGSEIAALTWVGCPVLA